MSYEEEEEPVCRLSLPADLHTLSRRAGRDPPFCFKCGEEKTSDYTYTSHYHCTTCDVHFHDDCHLSPGKMTHPYHPQHPLVFSGLDREAKIIYDYSTHDILPGIPYHGKIDNYCTWCGKTFDAFEDFYLCFICHFCLCLYCSKNFPPPIISNPKSHHHSLIFLPRPLLSPCDACGLVKQSKPSYGCFQCNFMVHRGCIDLPRVIKITRHPHRLSYTPFFSPTISSCRLCYKAVDIKYGQYSCNYYDCSYEVHSKCATHKKVWDGRELEWEPEECGESEDVAPFKKVGDDLIKYFCHEHHLKLEKYDGIRDVDKQCQACILHIDSQDFYNCMQCDFFLHEVCANLPRKLDHALHQHPLLLDPAPLQQDNPPECLVCSRKFAGFMYKCSKNNCEDHNIRTFQVDVRCILVSDCFTHKSHEHPLFIPISTGKEMIQCGGCNLYFVYNYLKCTLCEYALCYACATIPDKVNYKYDALPLSLCYGEVSDETYWCEACEKELNPCEWFYTCNKTYITIHRSCVFGSSAYMKPGYTLYCRSRSVIVLCNSNSTRPICGVCGGRCSSSVYFKVSNEIVICSFTCLNQFWWWN